MSVINRLVVLSLTLAFELPAAASDTTPLRAPEECWKGSFTKQLSGPVHEISATARGSGYTRSYDGYFKWKGKPAIHDVASEYVFCFTMRLDDGGALIANGKRIELDRVGSTRRPPLVQKGASNTSSVSDAIEFPRLYGLFSTPGKPDTSLEIQLEPLRGRVVVVSGTRDQAGRRIVSFLEGMAVRLTP